MSHAVPGPHRRRPSATRDALAALLRQGEFDVVGEAADAESAIERAGELRPDLILLDLSLPGMSGVDALPHLRAAAPEAEVVVLTASGTEASLLGAIRAGAAGYLLKSEPPERILEFLRGVARGEAALSGSRAHRAFAREEHPPQARRLVATPGRGEAASSARLISPSAGDDVHPRGRA